MDYILKGHSNTSNHEACSTLYDGSFEENVTHCNYLSLRCIMMK